MLKSVDEIIAACCAAKAKGHAEDAARSNARVREAVATFEAARAGHATPYVARNAAVSVRLRTTRAAQHAAQNVRAAEYQAERARRAAKTPLARKLAAEAQESVLIACGHADSAMWKAYAVCSQSSLDVARACDAYKAE
jgi:hypothetical protein